jgi:hypothetical protein
MGLQPVSWGLLTPAGIGVARSLSELPLMDFRHLHVLYESDKIFRIQILNLRKNFKITW